MNMKFPAVLDVRVEGHKGSFQVPVNSEAELEEARTICVLISRTAGFKLNMTLVEYTTMNSSQNYPIFNKGLPKGLA